MLKVADKRRLLVAAGFGPPGSTAATFKRCWYVPADAFKRSFGRCWFVPRVFCPELETTGCFELSAFATAGVNGIPTGKMLPFEEAWQRYEQRYEANTTIKAALQEGT
jgi:hypothetical protein